MKTKTTNPEAVLRASCAVLATIYERPVSTTGSGAALGQDLVVAAELRALGRRKSGRRIKPSDGEALAAALKGV
jgi:hypothetical protein